MIQLNTILAILPLLLPTQAEQVTGPARQADMPDEQQTPPEVSEAIKDLLSKDLDRIADAQAYLVSHPKLANPALQKAMRSMAANSFPESFESMLTVMKTFQAMGPGASDAIEFMVKAVSLVPTEEWSAWYKADREASSEARNQFWKAMRLAIGATGRLGLTALIQKAEAKETVPNGPPYSSIVGTILPNGADSMAYVAELAFSDDPAMRKYGSQLAHYAEDDLGPHLEEPLKGDRASRERCLSLLHSNLPHSLATLSLFLSDEEVELRRLVLTALARSANRCLLDPDTQEYGGYEKWHGPLHPTPTKPFATLNALRSPDGQSALLRSLSDTDDTVRTLAAFVLFRLSTAKSDSPKELLKAQQDSNPAVAYWATEAVARRQDVDLRWLTALGESPALDRWPGITAFDTKTQGELEELNASLQDYAAKDPAKDCKKAIMRLQGLSLFLKSHPDRTEKDNLLLEGIRHRAALLVVAEMDNGAFGQGMGFDAMHHFQKALYPEFEWDFLQEPRFSVGLVVFEERAAFFEKLGDTALPLLTQALFHWREGGRQSASSRLKKGSGQDPIYRSIAEQAAIWWQ